MPGHAPCSTDARYQQVRCQVSVGCRGNASVSITAIKISFQFRQVGLAGGCRRAVVTAILVGNLAAFLLGCTLKLIRLKYFDNILKIRDCLFETLAFLLPLSLHGEGGLAVALLPLRDQRDQLVNPPGEHRDALLLLLDNPLHLDESGVELSLLFKQLEDDVFHLFAFHGVKEISPPYGVYRDTICRTD